MATLLLQAAGSALFGAFGPVGAAIGQAAGALAGSALDRALIGGTQTARGRPLAGARIAGADEGTGDRPRLRHDARRRHALLGDAVRGERSVAAAGWQVLGPEGRDLPLLRQLRPRPLRGRVAGIRRVWADGKEIDTTGIEMRVHRGTADQPATP